MDKDIKIDWKQLCKKIDDGSLTTGEYTELLALIFRIMGHLGCDYFNFFQDFIQAVKIWLQDSKPNHVKLNGDLLWMETHTTSVFPIVVQYLNVSDLAKLKMVKSQFNQAIIIKIIPKIKLLNHMIRYFNRTYFKYNAKRCLSSISLDHLDRPDLTIFDLLLYLVLHN